MELNVAYSADENYCRQLMVSILSLIENNTEFNIINIYILANGISQANKQVLLKLVEKSAANLIFIDFSVIEEKLKTDHQFPLSAFGRLFLDDIIPKEKVLYLDCDSVVYGSLYDLMQTDMQGYICGAVQDTVNSYYRKAIGLKPDDLYFNSGFLLIDLKQWRLQKIQEKAIDMIARYGGSVPHHDQGVINAVCRGKILQLHPRYNLQCPMFEYTPKQLLAMNSKYYTVQEIEEAKKSPVFIHYTEGFSNRPWRDPCTHPYVLIYREYLRKTPFADQIDYEPINRKSEIVHFAYRILPFPLYRVFLTGVSWIKRWHLG